MFSINISNIILVVAIYIISIIAYLIIKKKFINIKKKIFIIYSSIFLVGVIVFFGTGVFGRFVDINSINTKQYSTKDLTEDLKQLEKSIMKENPLYFADKKNLQVLFKGAYEKIDDGMTELEFYRLINPIVVDIHCGHTNLSISQALQMNRKENAKFFPLDVTLINNQLYILENDETSGVSAGDEILSINKKSSDEIINILIKNTSGDGKNEAKPRYIISKFFNNKFYDFVDDSNSFKVQLIKKDGTTYSVNLNASYREKYNTSAWELHSLEFKGGDYYNSVIYDDYALLNIRVFFKEKGNDFNSFLDDFFSKLQKQNIDKLVIDLRGNYGGNPDMAKALLSHLITKKMDYFNSDLPFLYNLMGYQKPILPAATNFQGETAILTDGACFSTTGQFCSLFKYHDLGTVVGMETGGTYVCTDGSEDIILNNTRLRLHYSTLAYKVAVKDMSDIEGVKPDVAISPSVDMLLNHKDLTMEKAINILGK